MSSYLSMTGVVSQIQPSAVSGSGTEAQTEQDCRLSLTLQTYYQGTVLFTFTGDTYVLDIVDPADEIMALMLVIAIDAANCSQGNN